MFGQHNRPISSNEQILRWWILLVRMACYVLLWNTARATSGSDGVCVSSSHQMYIPQVWCFRFNTKTRFALYSPVEYCQRKDLHLHMVLVSDISVHVSRINNLSRDHYFHAISTADFIECQKPHGSPRNRADCVQQTRSRGLVDRLHARKELGSHHLQGCDGWVRWTNSRHEEN